MSKVRGQALVEDQWKATETETNSHAPVNDGGSVRQTPPSVGGATG